MNKLSISVFVFLFVVLVSCNKDDEIVIDDPGTDTPGTVLPQPVELDYKVLELMPGPGQYINDPASGYGDVTTMEEACEYATKRLSEGNYVSLGAWGGYITVKFDNVIENSGGYDFAIAGNSFDTSNEPGIVWVMADTNGNGLPDDEWFELRGSYFGMEGYMQDYSVTYYKPGPKEDTPWTDCFGDTGTVTWMGSYHSQDYYYPLWIKEDSYTLYGSRLPSRAFQDASGIWVNEPFEWGYADNFGTDIAPGSTGAGASARNRFRISDAVYPDGSPADLPSIDFIKVQTAVNSKSGWLGENSTEVLGFYILNRD